MRVKIVTDSPSDVPDSLVKQYDLRVIPCYINFGTQSYLDDGVSITRTQFYERLVTANPLPTTSANSSGDAEKVMREALQAADHVVAVHIAGKLSSIIESSRIAAQTIGTDKVTVIDTEAASMGSGWQVLAAAEKASQGADLAEILATIDSTRSRQKLWATVPGLDYLRRSGRVSWLRASVGALLNIKPIIYVDHGAPVQAARVRTFKNAVAELVKLARSQAPLERLALLHTHNLEGAQELQAALADIAPPHQTVIVNVSSAIGTHLGPGGLGIATIRKQN